MDNSVVNSLVKGLANGLPHLASPVAPVGMLAANAGSIPSGAADLAYFAVGFGPMDEIHREFHDLLAALDVPGDQGEKLLALHEHLLGHCSQEERWMHETNFPAGASHAREHETLLEVVAEVRRRFDAGDSDIVHRLAEELPRWFERHANTMDAALAVHLRERAPAGAPLAADA